MRKIFLCLCLLLILCGCETGKETEKVNVIEMPTSSSFATVNGYKTESYTITENKSKAEYVANLSTKKFHINTCQYAKSKNPDNIFETNNRDDLISDGYVPCKKCNP